MRSLSRITRCLLVTVLGAAVPGRGADRILRAEMTVPGPVEKVWDAWTTVDGLRSFFAPAARVDLRVDGLYDIVFDPSRPGTTAEGMRILALDAPRRFAFTWSAPPTLAEARAQRTVVIVELAGEGTAATRLRFTHLGWGEGKAWDAAYAYFDNAWRAVVLPRLKHRFEKGPIDWSAPPSLPPITPSLAVDLVPRQD
jgi:uncharacterized protein YndB with AHSA1/START domain